MRRLTFCLLLLTLSIAANAQSIPAIKNQNVCRHGYRSAPARRYADSSFRRGLLSQSAENRPVGASGSYRFPLRHSRRLLQLPVLQGAPSFVRPMILRGMRKDMLADEQAHFIPILDHEDEWKSSVSFSAPDDAYILLTDSHGHVVWQTHGSVTDASYDALKSAVSKLLASPPQ